MNDLSWLKRKYPYKWSEFISYFGFCGIEYLRKGYKIGKLREKVGYGNKGDLCLFKRMKEYIEDNDSDGNVLNSGWSGNFEIQHITTDGKYFDYSSNYYFLCEEYK